MAELECNVCGKPAVGVASSALGAISFAFCVDCLKQPAEPIYMFETTAWTCGNNVHEGVRAMYTFVDGEYISWDNWFAKYGDETIERLDKDYQEYLDGIGHNNP